MKELDVLKLCFVQYRNTQSHINAKIALHLFFLKTSLLPFHSVKKKKVKQVWRIDENRKEKPVDDIPPREIGDINYGDELNEHFDFFLNNFNLGQEYESSFSTHSQKLKKKKKNKTKILLIFAFHLCSVYSFSLDDPDLHPYKSQLQLCALNLLL
ncbi:hypothetical protein RFI_14336 [Reticulomyxa filosa]|uniref:Uncharacterized protein n=1 Tax=Reticulomyxa filosa TaxID=46433 RepID=X6NC15_RETFI|nr:hypothetical protein RFI_14336 [Reticulomyxa filosa]|eukprot:ETO22857.1 hypothetical protein RFI_14336 [Reticulomyxa filosa]